MNHIIIVESPAKTKTLRKFLGAKYNVKASMGHIRDLPKKTLAIDVENGYEPKYEIPTDKKKIVNELYTLIHKYPDTLVWLATDEDREGESIAWHLKEALKLKKGHFKRIAFHEITKAAVLRALEHPREIDINLVHAQQARRVLDRLVGYKLSPLLWTKVRGGLSAGRVQSVAVRLVVEREREILAFKPEEFWKILAQLQANEGVFSAELHKYHGKKLEVHSKTEADHLLTELQGTDYTIEDVEKKESRRQPAPPFITSTLQQEASRRLGFSVKQTMMIAQQLYEGVEHGKEHTGLITYMRTDSFNLSQEFLNAAPGVIEDLYGKKYVLPQARVFTKKTRGAQEAHEAIRPTDAGKTPQSLKEHLDAKQYRLYKLIWERAIASQMPEAVFDVTTATVKTKNGYELTAKGQVLREQGFMKAYVEASDEDEAEEPKEATLPRLHAGESCELILITPEQKFTMPAPRYTEASLVKKLESEGIGRPSTYAPTISTIITRGYIEKGEDKKLRPTEIGMIVNDFLCKHFPKIVDFKFTANMEERLDDIAEGKVGWQPVIDDFYKPFAQLLEEKKEEVKKEDVIHEKTDEICDLCDAPMKVKLGRNGKFLSCSKYPECKNAKPMKAEREKEAALQKQYKNEKCDKCGKPMTVKRGRFGEFLACSGYPKCKTTRPLAHALNVKCPKCDKALVEKRTKRRKVFYGCSGYPDCEFATWHKPITDPCPVCKGVQVQAKKDLIKCEQCGKETEIETAPESHGE
ncbi:MAG: type I DNA topoisomerase [Candidatus Peregrinibacteria bacterium]